MGRYLPVIKTAQCGSLTRAAQVLGYTQPSLSYIISSIEKELGVQLFHRSQRGMTVTSAGEPLLEYMRRIEALEETMLDCSLQGRGGLLRLGIVPGVDVQWLPSILSLFSQEHAGVFLRLEYPEAEGGWAGRIKARTMDCAFLAGCSPAGEAENLERIVLMQDDYVLAVGQESTLGRQEALSWSEVYSLDTLLPTREWMELDSCNSPGRIEAFPQDAALALHLAAQNQGAAICSRLALWDIPPDMPLCILPIRDAPARTLSLLLPAEGQRAPFQNNFLHSTLQVVEAWKQKLGDTSYLLWKKCQGIASPAPIDG